MLRLTPFLFVCFSAAAVGQIPNGTASFSEEQIVGIYNAVAQHAARVGPMLSEVHADGWVAKGAPDTYVTQLRRSLDELRGIGDDMAALARQPYQLTEAMKALFRAQASHQLLSSLMGGLRKYQNPALADLIESVSAEDQGDLARFEKYLLELAGDREAQFKVVDSEAQRCRATLSRQPAPPVPPARPAVRKTQP